MRIVIEADTDEKKDTLVFSNETLNNDNYVDIITTENVYTISLNDLIAVTDSFKVLREENKKL